MATQLAIPGAQEFEKPPAIMRLIEVAVEKGAGIDTVERLVALQERMMTWQAEAEFNEAMSRAQAEIKAVAPDLFNKQTNSRYESYKAIDDEIRPVYSKEGFSLSFNTGESKLAGHIKILCKVRKGRHHEWYEVDLPNDGKGAKGGDVMTGTHATGSAMTYGQRYLAKMIFNIPIDRDTDGNASNGKPKYDKLEEVTKWIATCPDWQELTNYAKKHFKAAMDAGDLASMRVITMAQEARRRDFEKR